MTEFNYRIIYGSIHKDSIWIRLKYFNCGISIRKTAKLFSERYGYVKSLPLPYGWRVGLLKARL